MYGLLAFIGIIGGFILLWLGGNLLVDGSSSIAKRFKIPDLIIGLTLVAFGTSAPELVVNLIAAINQKSDIIFGNVLGSNIANILLILGVSGLIYPLVIKKKTLFREIPLSLLATLYVLICVYGIFFFSKSWTIPRWFGVSLLIFFISFLYYIFFIKKNNELVSQLNEAKYKLSLSLFFVIMGLVFLPVGGNLVIRSAVYLAKIMHLSEAFISLFLISLGTSLPELFTCAAAAFQKNSDIAIGNAIGSNIFNILLILGVSSIFSPLDYRPIFNIDIAILLVATTALIVFCYTWINYKIDRQEAFLLLSGYGAYLFFLFFRG